MGGGKAGLGPSSSSHRAALPPTQPSPPQAGGGLAPSNRDATPFPAIVLATAPTTIARQGDEA
ncbi:hypothetical protein BOSE127_170208 [Bosea sp. 127]|nr:hypothetical protein BOSE127_170208 [Bosea sp. 127]